MKLGEKQTLTVVKQVDFGVYLAEQQDDETRVLLPAKQVPEGTKLHDKLEVFLYKDSKDRLIATTNEPKLTLGGFAVLKVVQVTQTILIRIRFLQSNSICCINKINSKILL